MSEPAGFNTIVSLLGKIPYKFSGDAASVSVRNVKTLQDSNEHSMVWVKDKTPAIETLNKICANLIIVNEAVHDLAPSLKKGNYLFVPEPKLAFSVIANALFVPREEPGIHPTAVIDPSAIIGEGVYIGPNVVISANCKIGNHTRILGNNFIYDNVQIGENCLLHASCVIGATGSGFSKNMDGEWVPFPQIGFTIIEDNVEVGALTYINKGAIGETRIGRGSKIGLSVCIGHNVKIGKNAMIIANSVVAGSCELGDDVWIAHGSTIRNSVKIGKGAFVGMGSVVTKNVKEGETVVGVPAKKFNG